MKYFQIRIGFLLVIELFAREDKYAWNTTGTDLSQHVHLLLKEGLKIGYLPPTQYNRKFICGSPQFTLRARSKRD